MPVTERTLARVARIQRNRGFAFVTNDEHRRGVFLHSSKLEGITFEELKEGEELYCEIGDGRDGLLAVLRAWPAGRK
ncbi:cold-shock protein [Alsobacter sp. R-9]